MISGAEAADALWPGLLSGSADRSGKDDSR